MNWKVRLSVRAKSEFIDAVKYFDSISISISEKFIKQIFDGLNTIEKNPLAYVKVKGNFRQFVLQEMPFLIVFTVQQIRGEILFTIFFTHPAILERNLLEVQKNKDELCNNKL